ncbi:LHFPL tetraspan subfamily member 2 protein-like [Oscarella lobularis]|uniref:LHFPL tetraspan subfamily member 2 protein-like n=1 Tax=Oscarella lobularis TaxID=121494 RepID=UPI003313F922
MTECVCVVASRTVLWLLFTFTAFGCCVLAFLTPTWLVAPSPSGENEGGGAVSMTPPTFVGTGLEIGLVKRCLVTYLQNADGGHSCRFLGFAQYDAAAWKASVVLFGVSAGLLAVATTLGIVTFWKQNVGRYNIVSIAGLIQGLSMFILVPGATIYPIAWSSDTFRQTCGQEASIYNPGTCSVGWGIYVVAAGIVLTLFACLLSPKAAKACNSHRVEEKIGNGYSCIFVP